MNDRELAFTPAYELAKLIAQKKLSPVELTEACLRRVEELNPRLNAFLTITADEAMDDARNAEEAVMRGETLSPLHGVPTSIKDLELTKGVRTTKGSLAYQDWVPDQDEIVVERIRSAGAIILGKTNTPEFGLSGTTENRLGDDCRNPWNPERVSGGSSGGAAASVASGMHPIAQGSDGGGSIRIPSGFCGLYGIKGTQGRVPRRHAGISSWHPVNFSQIGPMTRTVRDAALFLQVMSGPHPEAENGTILELPPDFTTALGQGVKGLRMAWSPDLGSAAVDPEVKETAEASARVFQELGASVEIAPFKLDIEELLNTYMALASVRSFINYGHVLEKQADLLMPNIREIIEKGPTVTGVRYSTALSELEQYRAYVDDFFTKYDLLLTPTLAVPAFPCGQKPKVIGGREVDERLGFTPFTPLFNMTRNPAASVPCGFSEEGLPIGLHVVGRRGDEVTILRASAAFEEARPWADKFPPVS
jgi:Asp-tRNA(Asn)/Glu-tRNA(Gln) amidotransferase A subunit family amidase